MWYKSILITRTMISRSKAFWLLMLTITIGTALCYDDDDDDVLSEVVIDLLTGIVIEECGRYQTCKMFLTIITITILLTAIFACIISGECHCRPLTGRELRRVGTTYAGMRLRRAFG